MQYQCPKPCGSTIITSREIDTHRVMLQKLRDVPQVRIASPEDVVKFMGEMADFDRERFKILHLDVKNRVIGVENLSEGTLNASLIHPRESLKGAILNSAAGAILVHNHPSGLSQPSHEDDMVISKLIDAFNIMGLDVLDAIILSKEGKGYYSYKEAGRLSGKGTGGIEKVMEDKDDKCDIAMKAAMSTIQDYCGDDGKYVTDIILGGTKLVIEIPQDIIEIRADRNTTEEEKTQRIKESPWAKNKANELCAEFMTTGSPDCIERITTKLAEGMIRKPQEIDKERREERKSFEKMWEDK